MNATVFMQTNPGRVFGFAVLFFEGGAVDPKLTGPDSTDQVQEAPTRTKQTLERSLTKSRGACCNADFLWSSMLRSEPHKLAARCRCRPPEL